MFRLHDDHGALVRRFYVLFEPPPIAMRSCETNAARSERSVPSPLHDTRGFLGAIHLRHDDAIGTEIERGFDGDLPCRRDAHQTRRAIADGLQNRLDIMRGERPVFAVDEQPVEADIRQNLGDRSIRQCYHRAQQCLTGLQA